MLKIALLATATATATAALTGVAGAHYPEKPIAMIVPWNAGGGTDVVARMLASGLEKELGVPVSVVNRSGGAGVIGHNAMVSAPKDGYTIGFATAEMLTYYWTGNADFTARDFTPIALVNLDPGAVHVSAGRAWNNVKDALAEIREKPRGAFKMSGAAIGSAYHLAFAGFLQQQGIDPLKVTMAPSQGAAPGFQELAAGGVDIIPSSLPEGKTMMQAGKSKALAVFSKERNPSFPAIATAGEQTGQPYSAGTWRGVVGPAGISEQVRQKLEGATKAAFAADAFQSFMKEGGYGAHYMGSVDFDAFLTDTQKSVGAVMKSIGLAKRDR